MNHTIQREAVFKELMRNNNHPTADDIHMKLRTELPQISLATVYRNLEQMVKIGRVRKIMIAGSRARFEPANESHFHLYCIKCKQLKDVDFKELSEIDRVLKKLVERNNFIDYEFDFKYICESCRKNQEEQSAVENSSRSILSMLD